MENVCHRKDQEEELRELLTYDLFSRDYVKNPPSFVRPRSGAVKREVRDFLDREVKEGGILADRYAGLATRQLYHMVYMDLFTIDMEQMAESGRMKKSSPYYLLFDYRKRNPLNHSAGICVIQHLTEK